MKNPKKREPKKKKMERCCYNCKYRWQNCENVFKVKICDKFKFDANSKSI